MMTTDSAFLPLPVENWTDEHIVERVVQGDGLLFEILMRRHNQRIYRAIRGILRDDFECEDVMQETYVRAFEHLAQFEGRAKFSTWLTRIAVNEAIKRSIARGKLDPLDKENLDGDHEAMLLTDKTTPSPRAMPPALSLPHFSKSRSSRSRPPTARSSCSATSRR